MVLRRVRERGRSTWAPWTTVSTHSPRRCAFLGYVTGGDHPPLRSGATGPSTRIRRPTVSTSSPTACSPGVSSPMTLLHPLPVIGSDGPSTLAQRTIGSGRSRPREKGCGAEARHTTCTVPPLLYPMARSAWGRTRHHHRVRSCRRAHLLVLCDKAVLCIPRPRSRPTAGFTSDRRTIASTRSGPPASSPGVSDRRSHLVLASHLERGGVLLARMTTASTRSTPRGRSTGVIEPARP